jgi:hypothetical protein
MRKVGGDDKGDVLFGRWEHSRESMLETLLGVLDHQMVLICTVLRTRDYIMAKHYVEHKTN